MKATLIVIENEKDHAQAKALVEELMRSENLADRARMVAQARLIETYERSRSFCRASRATTGVLASAPLRPISGRCLRTS